MVVGMSRIGSNQRAWYLSSLHGSPPLSRIPTWCPASIHFVNSTKYMVFKTLKRNVGFQLQCGTSDSAITSGLSLGCYIGCAPHTAETQSHVSAHVFTIMHTILKFLHVGDTRSDHTTIGQTVCYTRPRHMPMCLPMRTI